MVALVDIGLAVLIFSIGFLIYKVAKDYGNKKDGQ